jgi:hypothetical protein
MNEIKNKELTKDHRWTWTGYKRLNWVDDTTGRKWYEGHFEIGGSPPHGGIAINFWARKPILALKDICHQCSEEKTPLDFHGKDIN